MFRDSVRKAIGDIDSLVVIQEVNEDLSEDDEVRLEGLRRDAATYKAQGDYLMNRVAVAHGEFRAMELTRQADLAYSLADRCLEEINKIEHYGIKGQQWGVRRTAKQLASARKAGSNTGKIKKQARKMSDEELQSAIKRLNLEKQYVELTTRANAGTKSRMERGRSEMATIAKASAKKAISAHTTNIMQQGITYAIQQKRPNYQPPGGKKK